MNAKNSISRFMLCCLLLASTTGCEFINPTEQIPGYVSIDSIQFEHGPGRTYQDEGSVKYSFTDSWIYVDNQYIGTFENPRTIPILFEGTHTISVRGGIIENGVAGTRSDYMKTANYDTIVDIQPNATLQIKPRVHYFSGTTFKQMEDFDDGGISLIPTNQDYAPLQLSMQSDTGEFEGAYGWALLDANTQVFEVASDNPFTLPYTTTPYIELNYKTDVEITVGLFITTTSLTLLQTPLVNLRPTSTWKK
ncbi:MAG: hypothetical protein ACKOA1_09425, partial [Bacteroidota bacterium]